MLESNHVSIYLFDHVVDTGEEVFAALVVARELLCQCDKGLVVHVERGGLKLWKAQFFEDGSEVNYVLCCFHGCVCFCLR